MPEIIPGRPTVVLVDPPYYRLYKQTYSLPRYPLSLGYLAAHARRETDWNIVVYNADFAPKSEPLQVRHLSGAGFKNYLAALGDDSAAIWRQAMSVICSYKPDVVGISAKSQTFASACMLAKMIRRASPATKIVVGGPHAAMVGKAILDCPDIDIAVRGEGEVTLVELLPAVQTGDDLSGVAGIFFRRNGEIIETAARALLGNLDALPFPHDSAAACLHEYELYPREAFSHIFATRGCPYNCFFCGSRNVWSRRVRFRSAANVVEELALLQAAGAERIHFDDDTFGVRQSHIRALCDLISARRPTLKWSPRAAR